jgi:hypothetical protein
MQVTVILLFLLYALSAWAQKPTIFTGGVVNAASYTTASYNFASPPVVEKGLSTASIVSIFGVNLASSTQEAKANAASQPTWRNDRNGQRGL